MAGEFASKWQAARQAGYSPDEILDHLQADPDIGGKIKTARDAGYSAGEIGLHLMGMSSTGAEAGDPTEGMGTGERLAAGAWRGVVHTAALGKKALNDASASFADTQVGGAIDRAGQAMGLPSAAQIQSANTASRDEEKRLSAPLLDTRAGKVGNFVGTVAAVTPTLAIPGANTYTGAALVGAGTGGVLSEGNSLKERTVDAALGAAGGAGGKALGSLVGAGARILRDKAAKIIAQRAPQIAQRQAAVEAARDAGYVLSPTTSNPSTLNKLLEGLSGKLTTAQQASLKNQEVTNRLARQALGLSDDTPLTADTLKAIRAEAGNAYGAIRSVGNLAVDAPYLRQLDDIVAKYQGASKDFPELAKTEVSDLVDSVRKGRMTSESAVNAISILREKADDAFARGNSTLGKAAKAAAGSLEDLIERNLLKNGQGQLLADMRNARQTIAKTYSVEKALNSATGNVNAQKLAQQLTKGKPLSGDLKIAANAAGAFPRSMQEITSGVPGISPLDAYGAGGLSALTQDVKALAIPLLRPAARSLLLSRPYQALMTTPSNKIPIMRGLLNDVVNNEATQRLIPLASSTGARGLLD